MSLLSQHGLQLLQGHTVPSCRTGHKQLVRRAICLRVPSSCFIACSDQKANVCAEIISARAPNRSSAEREPEAEEAEKAKLLGLRSALWPIRLAERQVCSLPGGQRSCRQNGHEGSQDIPRSQDLPKVRRKREICYAHWIRAPSLPKFATGNLGIALTVHWLHAADGLRCSEL